MRNKTLANPKLNLTPGQSQIVKLYGSDFFNSFLYSIVQGIAYLYIGGNTNASTPDFVFGPSSNPQCYNFPPIQANQITIICPTTIQGDTAINLVGSIYINWMCEP